MKDLIRFGLILACALFGQWPSVMAATLPPRILQIYSEDDALVVVADVPEGVRRVVLESCRRGDLKAWLPRLVQRPAQPGTLTFRLALAAAEGMEMFRVRADDEETLPPEFFTGPTRFPGSLQGSSHYSALPPGVIDVRAPDDAVIFRPTGMPPLEVAAESNTPRSVVEADIWKISGDTLYLFNQFRGLQIIDLADSAEPELKATLAYPASGEDLYLHGPDHVLLLARSRPCDAGQSPSQESAAIVIDVSAEAPLEVARVPLPGRILESRLVGSALYVATETWQPGAPGSEADGAWENGTILTGIDLSAPESPAVKPSLWLPGSGNVVSATERFLMVATIDTAQHSWWDSELHLVDIADPAGTLREFATIPVGGRIEDKFKLNVQDDVLTVIAFGPASGNEGGRTRTVLTTYRLSDPADPGQSSWAKLGSVEVGHGENLFATRFDNDRAYIVTFRQIDPLWIVDLSEAESPRVVGELEIPGWSTYIHPLGDRLLTIGIDDVSGSRVALQLFDVSDPRAPRLMDKVPLGREWSSSEATSTEKALGVFSQAGLVLVPFTSANSAETIHGVQLVDLHENSLDPRGVIRSETIVPRRTTLHDERILAISPRELITVSAEDRDQPQIQSILELAYPVDRVLPVDDWVLEFSENRIRVRRANGSGQGATEHRLESLPVAGVTARDGLIYTLQVGRPGLVIWNVSLSDSTAATPSASGRTLLSIFDAAALPDLELIGTVTATITNLSGTDFQALWPRPGVLVWDSTQSDHQIWPLATDVWMRPGGLSPGILTFNSSSIQFRFDSGNGTISGDGVFFADPSATRPAVMLVGDFAAPGFAPWLWWPSMARDLLAYDVGRRDAPRLISRFAAPETSINRSEGFASEGLVFFSHDIHESEITGTNEYVSTELVWVTEPREIWVTNRVRVPYPILVTNLVEARFAAEGWEQPLPGATEGVAVGRFHVLTRTSAGDVSGWGDNRAGQLGAESVPGFMDPEPIALPGAASHLAAAAWLSMARLVDGTLWTWGSPDGPLPPPIPGEPNEPGTAHRPRQLSGVEFDLKALTAGYGHFLALTTDGALHAWGLNDRGQLGTGDTSDRDAPVEIIDDIAAASAGGLRSLALTTDGRVVAWGEGSEDASGPIPGQQALSPVTVSGLPALRAISAGDSHSLGLDADGGVWVWGQSGADGSDASPAMVDSLPPIRGIAAGQGHSVAVDESGTVWSWGEHSRVPLEVKDIPPVTEVYANNLYALVRTGDERCFLWSVRATAAPQTSLPRPIEMSRITGTNVTTGTAYRFETNIVKKIVEDGHWEERVVTNSYPVYRTWIRHELDVIDFTGDPSNPVLRPSVSLPGPLRGVSHEGSLLYTLATRVDAEDETTLRTWLEAGAYDGVAVHLVNSLELAKNSAGASAVADVDPRGIVLVAVDDGKGTNTLSALALNTEGRFVSLDVRRLEQRVFQMEIRDRILALSSSARVLLLDVTDQGELQPLGEPFEQGCLILWFNRLAGDRREGLWAPLGDFGAARLY
jgi:alpha-tubulin suppressor-like RCC1 family protein